MSELVSTIVSTIVSMHATTSWVYLVNEPTSSQAAIITFQCMCISRTSGLDVYVVPNMIVNIYVGMVACRQQSQVRFPWDYLRQPIIRGMIGLFPKSN